MFTLNNLETLVNTAKATPRGIITIGNRIIDALDNTDTVIGKVIDAIVAEQCDVAIIKGYGAFKLVA